MKDDSKYPNIYRLLNSVEYRDLKYNGMHTLLPSIAPENNWAIYIRQDWLDNLGLKQPKTLEEFAAVMEAFTTQDPDRNGKNDTYGLSSCKDSFWFMPFFAAFCPKDDWNYSADGKSMEYYYYTSGYKEYLRYMANLYSKGCIVKDYYTKTDDMKIEDFASGKAGILIHNADTHIQNIMSKVLNANPTAKIDVIAPPEGPAGANLHGWGGWWGGWSISANCKNPEAALRLLDFLISEEGTMLRYYGIKDVHYSIDDSGNVVINENHLKARSAEGPNRFGLVKLDGKTENPYGFYTWGPWFGSQYTNVDGKIKATTDYTYFQYKELALKADKICREYETRSDMYNIAVSDSEFLQTIKKIKDYANTFSINIITGEKPLESGWAEYMELANKAGYKKACETAYNATKAAGK